MQTGIIECWKCEKNTEIEDIDNLIEFMCLCGARTKGKAYPKPSTTLFTRRHYEWLVQMAHEMDLTRTQVEKLSKLLVGTNSKYQPKRFRTEFTLYTNKNSGGI
jgi:hypothetical protein